MFFLAIGLNKFLNEIKDDGMCYWIFKFVKDIGNCQLISIYIRHGKTHAKWNSINI